MSKIIGRAVLFILFSFVPVSGQESLNARECGTRTLLAMATGNIDLSSVGGASERARVREVSYGGYLIETEISTGLTTNIQIPAPEWCDINARIKVIGMVEGEIAKWKIPASLGYPEWVRFESIPLSKRELDERVVKRQRVSAFGKFFDEYVSYGFYTDSKGQRVCLGCARVRVSPINVGELKFEDISKETTIEDVARAFELVKLVNVFNDPSIVMDGMKIEQPPVLAHENSFFTSGKGGFQADLEKPIRRVRLIIFNIRHSGTKLSTLYGLLDPVSCQFVGGYPVQN